MIDATTDASLTAEQFDKGVREAARKFSDGVVVLCTELATTAADLTNRAHSVPPHLIVSSLSAMVDAMSDLESRLTKAIESAADGVVAREKAGNGSQT